MLRWTFHVTSALSLLLPLATVGLWVDSYWNATTATYSASDKMHQRDTVLRTKRYVGNAAV